MSGSVHDRATGEVDLARGDSAGSVRHGDLPGATGISADCRGQLDQAMTQLFAADGPALLHVRQDPELL